METNQKPSPLPEQRQDNLPLPPIVERERKRFAVICVSDIDGTMNNETYDEKNRLSSTDAAGKAIASLEAMHIPVGAITARSLGEADLYLKKLNATGPTICEDGAVAAIPNNNLTQAQRERLSSRFKIVSHGDRLAVVLSTVGAKDIKEFLIATAAQAREEDPAHSQNLVSTLTSTPEQIREITGHETIELARISAERAATAYAAGLSSTQIRLLEANADAYGLRTFMRNAQDVMLFFPKDAHKGHAIKLINDNAALFVPQAGDIQGIIPIVFGNHTNDLPLFEIAHQLGGIGVLVQHPDGNYAVSDNDIPPYVLRGEAPYGYGMLAAIPKVSTWLENVRSE